MIIQENSRDNLVSFDGLTEEVAKGHAPQLMEEISEAIDAGEIQGENIDLPSFVRGIVGEKGVKALSESARPVDALRESITAPAVSYTQFRDLVSKIMQNAVMPDFKEVGNQLINMVSTKQWNHLDPMRVNGATEFADPVEMIEEFERYPFAGVGDKYMTTPSLKKYGFQTGVTREMMCNEGNRDMFLAKIRDGKKHLTRHIEGELTKAFIGAAGYNNYNYSGTSYNTYISGGGGPYENDLLSKVLVDYTDIDEVNDVRSLYVSPDTGRYLDLGDFNSLFVFPALGTTARNIINGTEIVHTGGNMERKNSNPVAGMTATELSMNIAAELVTQGLATNLTTAQATWFLGDVSRMLEWLQCWGPEEQTQGSSDEDAFTNDIVLRWKWSYMGAPHVVDPRAVCRVNLA